LGASHQCAEDVAALRALPNLAIVSPADRYELEYSFKHILTMDRPSYLRFGKADLGDVHGALPQVAFGDLIEVRPGRTSYAFVATGSMVRTALELRDGFGDVPVWSVPVIAPASEKRLLEICRTHTLLFVMEEHSVNGGLGSLVAERAAETGGCRVVRLGIENRFSEVCGSYSYLMARHGLGVKELQVRIAATLAEMDCQESDPTIAVAGGASAQ
jgi:transketolase